MFHACSVQGKLVELLRLVHASFGFRTCKTDGTNCNTLALSTRLLTPLLFDPSGYRSMSKLYSNRMNIYYRIIPPLVHALLPSDSP